MLSDRNGGSINSHPQCLSQPVRSSLFRSRTILTYLLHLTTHFLAFPRLFSQPALCLPRDRLSKTRQGNEDNTSCLCPRPDYEITARKLVLAQLLPSKPVQRVTAKECEPVAIDEWQPVAEMQKKKKGNVPHSISFDLLQGEENLTECV